MNTILNMVSVRCITFVKVVLFKIFRDNAKHVFYTYK